MQTLDKKLQPSPETKRVFLFGLKGLCGHEYEVIAENLDQACELVGQDHTCRQTWIQNVEKSETREPFFLVNGFHPSRKLGCIAFRSVQDQKRQILRNFEEA